MTKDKDAILTDPAELRASILNACSSHVGIIDQSFLCKSIGTLEPKLPKTIYPDASIHEAGQMLQQYNVGCLLVCDSNDTLLGIFSERDFLTKVYNKDLDEKSVKISEIMTKDPVTATPDSPIAYGLSLMAQGGFRHLPIVDPEGMAVGIVSVRDFVDFIVEAFTKDILSFGSE